MTTPLNLTLQHAKIDARISILRAPLTTAEERARQDGAQLQELRAQSALIGEMLRGYVHREQRAVLSQAIRVLGESLEEVAELHAQNAALLCEFDRFNRALNEADDSGEGAGLEKVCACFDALCARFERQSDAERNFYSLYSTILFPAGAATD